MREKRKGKGRREENGTEWNWMNKKGEEGEDRGWKRIRANKLAGMGSKDEKTKRNRNGKISKKKKFNVECDEME